MKYGSTSFMNEVTFYYSYYYTNSMAAVACCKLTVDNLHAYGCKSAPPNEKEKIIDLRDWGKMGNHYHVYYWPQEIQEEFDIFVEHSPYGYIPGGTLYLVKPLGDEQYQVKVIYAGSGFHGKYKYKYPTVISKAEQLATFLIEGEEKLDRFHYLVSREKVLAVKQAKHEAWVKEVQDFAGTIPDYPIKEEIGQIVQDFIKDLVGKDQEWLDPSKLKVDYFYLYSKYLKIKEEWESNPPSPEDKRFLRHCPAYSKVEENGKDGLMEYMDTVNVDILDVLPQLQDLISPGEWGYDHDLFEQRVIVFSFLRYLCSKEAAV